MRIHLIAVGTRMPRWVNEGFETYARRLERTTPLVLHEVPLARGRKGTQGSQAALIEARGLLRKVPPRSWTVALDERGTTWSTLELTRRLEAWRGAGRDLALLIGGPDGLGERCAKEADERWSLSPLTLPHGLVRVLVAEQLYRASSILESHPYHRA